MRRHHSDRHRPIRQCTGLFSLGRRVYDDSRHPPQHGPDQRFIAGAPLMRQHVVAQGEDGRPTSPRPSSRSETGEDTPRSETGEDTQMGRRLDRGHHHDDHRIGAVVQPPAKPYPRIRAAPRQRIRRGREGLCLGVTHALATRVEPGRILPRP